MKIINLKGDVSYTDPENDLEEDLPFSKAEFEDFTHTTSDPHTITDIKQAFHDKNRANIFLGSKFAFSLDIVQVIDFHLKIGKVLTDKEIKELETASEFGKLYTSMLEWVLMRPRSVRETRDHLRIKLERIKINNRRKKRDAERKKTDPEFASMCRDLKINTHERKLYTEEDIERVINKLLEKKYLDDYRFASWYIENRSVKKGISKKRLSEELTKKGISKSIASELLVSSGRSENEEIKKVIQKRGARYTKDKLLRYLVSRGFPFELSKDMVEAYFSDPEAFSES